MTIASFPNPKTSLETISEILLRDVNKDSTFKASMLWQHSPALIFVGKYEYQRQKQEQRMTQQIRRILWSISCNCSSSVGNAPSSLVPYFLPLSSSIDVIYSQKAGVLAVSRGSIKAIQPESPNYQDGIYQYWASTDALDISANELSF